MRGFKIFQSLKLDKLPQLYLYLPLLTAILNETQSEI
jgi:hypothetical protein